MKNLPLSSEELFELLVRHAGRALVERSPRRYKSVVGLARRHFGGRSPLTRELEIFRTVGRRRGTSERVARGILREAARQASTIDPVRTRAARRRALRDCVRTLGESFFLERSSSDRDVSSAISRMIRLQTVPSTLEERASWAASDGERLVEHIMGRPDAPGETVGGVDPLVCQIAARSFKDRYSGSLIPEQRRLLDSYLRSLLTGDTARVEAALVDERSRARRALDRAAGSVEASSDPEMASRIAEARERLRALPALPLEERVAETMLFQRLSQEIEDDG